MEKIDVTKLGSFGKRNYISCDPEFGFLESGYFHVDDCEGDHHFYYRYLVNGEIWEMLEDGVHRLYKMTPDEREEYLKAYV